jgi:hypothetical protein
MLIIALIAVTLSLTFLAYAIMKRNSTLIAKTELEKEYKNNLTRLEEEIRKRQVYERALGIPLHEPERSKHIWAAAHRGDELYETILHEDLHSSLPGPEDKVIDYKAK